MLVRFESLVPHPAPRSSLSRAGRTGRHPEPPSRLQVPPQAPCIFQVNLSSQPQYIIGTCGYFMHSDMPGVLTEVEISTRSGSKLCKCRMAKSSILPPGYMHRHAIGSLLHIILILIVYAACNPTTQISAQSDVWPYRLILQYYSVADLSLGRNTRCLTCMTCTST